MENKKLIQKYLDSLSLIMKGKSDVASVTGHPSDTGTNREEILQDFINKHTPNKMEAILGGKILGLGQPESKQIDCMVCSDLAPRFSENTRSIAIVESVGVAISIKSHLDKNGIIDSMENIASIPQISLDVLSESSSIIRNLGQQYAKIAPVPICFAYSGIHPDKLIEYIVDFYQANISTIPENRRIMSIIVNGEYIIKTSREGMILENGKTFPPWHYFGSRLNDRPGAGLAELMHQLANVSTWYNQLKVDYFHYINEAYYNEVSE